MSSTQKPPRSLLKKMLIVELALTGVFVYLGATAQERPWARGKK